MTLRDVRSLLLAALVLGIAAPAAAAGEPAPAAIEPAAAQAASAAIARIAAAPGFRFVADLATDTALATGEKIQFNGRLEVAVRRPDGMRVVFDGEPRSTRSWYDGRTFTHFDPDGNAYATCEAPPTLDDLFPLMREQLGFTPPLAMLLREDAQQRFLDGVRSGYDVGPASVGGVATEHYAFRGDATDLQLWIDRGDAPVIRRILVTRRDDPGAPQLTATFASWEFGSSFGAGDFAFTPPAGAVLCEFIAPEPQEAQP